MKPLFLAITAVNAATMGLLLAQAPPPPPLPAGIPAGNIVIMERRIEGPGMQDVQIQRSGPEGAARGRGGPNGGATASGPAGPGGKLSGVVLDSITGQPLRKATVRLNKRGGPGGGGPMFIMGPGGQGGQGGIATTTNEEGKYNFDAVPAGDYFLSAERSGYIRGMYGARTPRSMGNTIQVKDEGDTSGLQLKLLPQSSISGRVLDAEGDPIQNAMVQVGFFSYMGGRKRIQVANMGQTNDRGEFRIANLAPGKYVVAADSAMIPMAMEGEPESKEKLAYTKTYFPSVLEESGAAPIDVQAGSEVTSINITQRKVAVYKVSGVVRGLAPGQDGRTNISLQPAEPGNMTMRRFVMSGDSSNIKPDGSFTLKNVVPGQYIASVMRFNGRPRTIGSTRVSVSRQDVEGLTVTIVPSGTLRGKMRVEEDQKIALEGSRVNLSGVGMMGFGDAKVNADGTFAMEEVSAENAYLRLSPPQGTYVKDIRYGGQSYLRQALPFENGTNDTLEVLLGTKPANVSGTVTIDKEKVKGSVRVILLDADRKPQDPMQGHSFGLPSQASADTSGQFRLANLPAGTYHLVAVETEDPNQVNVMGLVQLQAAKLKRVDVKEGESMSATLDVVTAAELEQLPQ